MKIPFRAIAIGLGVSLSLGTALAQPAPSPAPSPPAPPPDQPPPEGGLKTDEKAGGTLQEGQDSPAEQRPWYQGVSAAQQKTALALFREGNALLNDGLFPKAVEKYTLALKSWDHPAIHYNMALALMNLDQPIQVHEHLQAAIKFQEAPLGKDKFDHAKEYMLLVEKQIASVDVSCNKVGAEVLVDGVKVFTVAEGGENRYRARVKIGKHTFVARKTGYDAQIDAPFIEPGQNFRIELTLYTADELTRYKRRWNQTWLPYVVIGGGVALAAGAVGLQFAAGTSYKDFDAAVARCGTMGCAPDSGVDDFRKSGDTKRTMSYIGFGVAGGALVAGAALLYLNRNMAYQISADEYRKEQRDKGNAVSVTPLVAPTMAGAMIQGMF